MTIVRCHFNFAVAAADVIVFVGNGFISAGEQFSDGSSESSGGIGGCEAEAVGVASNDRSTAHVY